jgi:hypothetical protein
MAMYEEINSSLHDSAPGVHLKHVQCPQGCMQIRSADITGDTVEEKQAAADQLVANDPEVSIRVTSADPLYYEVIYGQG